jgi:PAS domain S-box-containing protein
MQTTPWLNRNMMLAFGSAILCLLIVGAMSFHGMVVSDESQLWIRHTHAVLENLQDLLLTGDEIGANSREYGLTGELFYLQSYRSSSLRIVQNLATFRNLTIDNPEQQRRLPDLERLTSLKIKRAETIVRLRESHSSEASLEPPLTVPDQKVDDEFQKVLVGLRGEELRLLVLRDTDAKRRLGQIKALLMLGTAMGLLVAAFAAWSLHRDTVGRRSAEVALRDSEENFRLLLNGIQDYAIFMLDPVGRIVSWNAGAERMHGYKAEEIVGRNFSCLFPAEDIQQGKPEEILRATSELGRHQEDGIRMRQDCSRFMANVTLTALRDPSGNLCGFSKISRDLTESVESAARYRGLMEAAPDGMVVVNQDGKIVLLNAQAEKQFGYRRDELLGHQVKSIIPEGFAERLIADGTRRSAPESSSSDSARMEQSFPSKSCSVLSKVPKERW